MMSVDASLEEFADTFEHAFEHAFEHVILHALTIRICGVIGNASKRLIMNFMKATRAYGIFVRPSTKLSAKRNSLKSR